MKEQAACRILKRARSAEVVEAVFFEQEADPGGRFCRGLGGGQPAFDFRSEIIGGGDGIHFEAGIAKKLEQFAEGKCVDVRRIAENFPLILIGGALRKFAGVNVFDEDCALRTADASHFTENIDRVLEMMKSEAANDNIEAGVFEGEMLRVGGAEGDVGEATLLRALFGDGEHRIGKVNTDNFAGGAGESFGDVARTGGDVENAFVTAQLGGVDEALDAVGIGDPGISGKSLCLRGEGFADDVVVLRHEKLLVKQQEYHRVAAGGAVPDAVKMGTSTGFVA
jgi:hypothetical protein